MSCDISSLSNHNLNLESIEGLANDLSNRFGYTVEYGYYNSPELAKLLGQNTEDDFVALGYIDKKEIYKKYRLISNNYQEKQLYEKFGEALFHLKKYHFKSKWNDESPPPTQEAIDEHRKEILKADYEFEVMHYYDGSTNLIIYDDIISNSSYYYSGWWILCDTIQDKDDFYHGHFDQYRLNKAKLTRLLGGDKLYYVNDQSKYLQGVGQGSEAEYTWESLQIFIQEKLEDCLISISKSILDSQYLWNIKLLDHAKIGFVDDFEDLKELL